MPAHARANGGDSLAAGRARQRLKLVSIGYASSRHGIDADVGLTQAGLIRLCQTAVEFVDALAGGLPKNQRIDLQQGDVSTLQLAAIAYASARHGIDADVGMAREGLALLCQAAISYVESLPREDFSKRSPNPHLQLSHGGS
jgi:hypothetical protein